MIARYYELLKIKLVKVQVYIKFIKICWKKSLIQTLAKVSRKLELRLVRKMKESEKDNKHHQKRKLKKETVAISSQLKKALGLLLYNVLAHKTGLVSLCHFTARRNCYISVKLKR